MTEDAGCTRFAWEQIVRRARFTGVIPAQGKRGAISGAHFKAVAWAWSSFANPDGTKLFPGIATVAIAAEVGYRTARLVTAKLIDLGLLERVKGSIKREGNFDEYRLAIPANLLDQLEVLNPDQMKSAAASMRSAYRGSAPQSPDGGLADPHPTDDDDRRAWGSTGPTDLPRWGSTGPTDGGLQDRGTYTSTEPCSFTEPSIGGDLRTDVTVGRADEDPILIFDQTQPGPAACESPALREPRRCERPLCRGGVLILGVNRKQCDLCHPQAA
jgi:hypothetical protein